MSHKFLAGAGLLVLAGWGVSGLAVAGSDIKQVDLTLRILVDGPVATAGRLRAATQRGR